MSTEKFSLVSLSRLVGSVPLELLVATALACLIILLWTIRPFGTPHYEKVGLLTEFENDFFFLLRSALPGHLIFPHLAMREVVRVVSGPQMARTQTLLDREHIDFVICTRMLDVVCAVQLVSQCRASVDDREHIMSSVGISTLHFSPTDKPTIEQLRRAVFMAQLPTGDSTIDTHQTTHRWLP